MLKLIVNTLLLIKIVSSSYNYKSTLSLSESPNTFALAPQPKQTSSGFYADIAFGFSNGSISLSSTDNIYNSYTYYPFFQSNPTVRFMSWNTGDNATIFAVSNKQIAISNVYGNSNVILLTFNDLIIYAVCRYTDSYPNKYVIAVAFIDRIQIYSNNTRIQTKIIKDSFQTMQFDITGKYLYYFDGYTRYVLKISDLSIFNTYSSSQRQKYIVASPKYGYEDITVAVDQQNYMSIWDDYTQLYYYSNAYGIKSLAFTEDSNYLVYLSNFNKLNIYKTNYASFGSWVLDQTFDSSYTVINGKVDAQNSKIAVLNYWNIFIYEKGSGSSSTLVVIIVCSVVGFILCVGIVAFCFKRKRAQLQQKNTGYQNFNNDSSQQTFNNPTYPINNNANSPYFNNQGYNQGYNNNYNQPYNSSNPQNYNQGYPSYNQPYPYNAKNNQNVNPYQPPQN